MMLCLSCGFRTKDMDDWERHLIVDHTDAVIDELVTQVFREAIQIAALEKMWRLTA